MPSANMLKISGKKGKNFMPQIIIKLFRPILSILAAFATLMFGYASFLDADMFDKYFESYPISTPAITSSWENTEGADITGDFYVSTKGNDSNKGTKDAPFLTIEKAIEAVANTDKTGKNGITVLIEAGEYRVSSLSLSEASGTKDCPVAFVGYGEKEAVINAGIALSASDFATADNFPEIAQRLSISADKVLVLDLTKAPYNLTAEDWGKLYPIGTYNTADSYKGDTTGPVYSELFVNEERQTLARYPDSGFIYTEEVLATGIDSNIPDENGDPATDKYRISESLAKRIAGWEDKESVWMYGYWKYDWADGSSPIGSFSESERTLSPKYRSFFGTKEDAPYYFYNCLEELTAQGEWYLDREKGLLCVYAPENRDTATYNLSLSLSPVITLNADYVTLDNLTVKGARHNGIELNGNNNTIKNCKIVNVSSAAIVANGNNNTFTHNEIANVGAGGIAVTGGDRSTLTAGNNIVSNNLIHDWGEIYRTYRYAVDFGGVGNICSSNEMYNAPHGAVTYSGNNHIFEYNLIYNVCLLSDDTGAIYAGRSWTSYGNIIRYNCIHSLGADGHTPDGIYLDDALSGQTVYGNILVNIPKYAIHAGGGRDNTIQNNVIVNAGEQAIKYDNRARDGALLNGWFNEHVNEATGDMWIDLKNSPYQTEIWQEAFPQYKSFSSDFSDSDNPGFVPNPAGSIVSGNVIVDRSGAVGDINDDVTKFSTVENNAAYTLFKTNKVFTDADNGDYTLKDDSPVYNALPEFEEIPLERIGRK